MRSVEEALEITEKLLKWDPAGDDWVKIKQVTAAANAKHQKLLEKQYIERERKTGQETITERQVWDIDSGEIQFQELYLTFADTSLSKTVEDGKGNKKSIPLFTPGLPESAFRAVYNAIKEQELLDEWQELVWKVNPHWCPYVWETWKPRYIEKDEKAPLGAEAETKNS